MSTDHRLDSSSRFPLQRGQTNTVSQTQLITVLRTVGVLRCYWWRAPLFAGSLGRVTSRQVGDEGRAQIVSSAEEEQSAKPSVGH